jgi:hypothetical protein
VQFYAKQVLNTPLASDNDRHALNYVSHHQYCLPHMKTALAL